MQSLSSFYDQHGSPMPASATTAILQRQLGTVQIGCRFRVVDTTLKRIPVMVEPNNWTSPFPFDPYDISPFISPEASLQYDTTRPVHGQLSFTMIDPEYAPGWVTLNPLTGQQGFPFDPLHTFIEVAQIISLPGIVQFEVPLGYYIMFLPQAQLKPGVRFLSWTGLDLTSLIAQCPFISDYVVYANYPGGYLAAIKDMLMVDSLPINAGGHGMTPIGNPDSGPAIPSTMFDFDYTYNQNVPVDMLFSAGSSRLEAANKLAEAVNYYPIFNEITATATGSTVTFNTEPQPFFQPNIIPAPEWDYSPTSTAGIIEGAIMQDFSSQADTRICNIVRVQGGTILPNALNQSTSALPSALKTLSSTQLNLNPNSIISLVNLKSLNGGPRAIGRFETNNMIPTQTVCDLRAKLLLLQGAMLPETLSFSSLHLPTCGDHDIVTCAVVNKRGEIIVPSSAASPFIETGWTLPLKASAGRMSHQVTRVLAI